MRPLSDVSVCLAYWAGNAADAQVTIQNAPDGVEVSAWDDCSKTRQSALNPCVPLNRAVEQSSRPVVVLTNPGTMIAPSTLERLLCELTPNGYVAAACWDLDARAWLCHSTWRSSEKLPPGAGFHFLAVLERSLWDRAGGFDERYREGQGYEDADFLWRLHGAGATFKILDDVVVTHRRSTTVWPSGGLERNRELYRSLRC